MTLLRPTTVAGIMTPKPLPRAMLPLYGIQLARVSKRAIERGITDKLYVFRNVPFRAVDPSPKQAAVRVAFALLASEAKGKKWEGRYPPAAEHIMRNADKIRAAAAAAPAVAPAKRYLHSRELEKIITKEVEEAVMRALGIAGPGEFASRLKTAGLVREYSVK